MQTETDRQTDKTRMHSSRMRTVRCSGRLLGVSAQGGVCLGGVYPGVSARPPTPRTESQTGVKTLPCRNYVADGNYHLTAKNCQGHFHSRTLHPFAMLSVECAHILTRTHAWTHIVLSGARIFTRTHIMFSVWCTHTLTHAHCTYCEALSVGFFRC